MANDIELLGKGAVPSLPDPRDYQVSFLFPLFGVGAPQVDWNQEFRLPEPPNTSQRSGDCCVGESSSSLHWQLTGKQYSVRSIFAYIYLDYGAFLRDGPKRIVQAGQQTFAEVGDPNPKSMQNMRDRTGLNPAAALQEKELDYYAVPANIESMALAIDLFKGCIFGLPGTQDGWVWDLTNPTPPKGPQSAWWWHALYAFGHHIHDGQKCIIAKSSWAEAQPGHHEHHIKKNYEPFLFDAWVLVPRKKNMKYIVNKGGKYGVLVSENESFTDVILWARNGEMLAQLKAQYQVPDNAPVINYP